MNVKQDDKLCLNNFLVLHITTYDCLHTSTGMSVKHNETTILFNAIYIYIYIYSLTA